MGTEYGKEWNEKENINKNSILRVKYVNKMKLQALLSYCNINSK
jgi:hypothetical protein